MANQITDNRTLLFDGGDGTGGAPDNLAGAATGSTDTSTFIEGSTSYTISITNSISGMLFDAGSAQDYSDNTFWLWVNCGVVGLLLAKASGGMTVRFCGATVTDWFEVDVGGNDSWPITFEGGWAMFVVDIEDASASPSGTNGTPPATTAIRYVGVTAETSIMPKMADNFWLDAIWRNPTVDPAWIVEGRNGGSTDWDMADVATELGVGAGLVLPTDGGSFTLFGPGQFGIDDTSTHGFTSLNDILLWANQEFILDGFYKLSALGNSGGTTNVTFGSKTGTGDAATGSQGAVISAAGIGTRWAMDFNDPDIDGANFYGCSFIHGEDFLLDDAAVSCISTLYIDCDSALVSNSEQLRVSVIAANTADGVAFMTTDDLSDIVFSSFEFSDGHGVELTTPNTSTQASKGNSFIGYGADATNDAAVYNNSGSGLVTINVTDGGTDITVRNGTSATTLVVLNPVTLEITVQEQDGTKIQSARVLVRAGAVGPKPSLASVTITQTGGVATVVHTAHDLLTGDKVIIEGVDNETGFNEYNGIKVITVTTVNAYTYTLDSGEPATATGTIVSSAVLIDEVTTAGGIADDTRTYTADQDIDGTRSRVRKSSGGGDIFKEVPVSGTIDSATGREITITMVPDE